MSDDGIVIIDSISPTDYLKATYIAGRVWITGNEAFNETSVALGETGVLELIEYLKNSFDRGLVDDDE